MNHFAVNQPTTSKKEWIANKSAEIHATSVGNCSVPPGVKIIWKIYNKMNDSIEIRRGPSEILKINEVNKSHAGSYFYEIIDEKQNKIIFKSKQTDFIFVLCKYFKVEQ